LYCFSLLVGFFWGLRELIVKPSFEEIHELAHALLVLVSLLGVSQGAAAQDFKFNPTRDAPSAVLSEASRHDGSEDVGVGLPIWISDECSSDRRITFYERWEQAKSQNQ